MITNLMALRSVLTDCQTLYGQKINRNFDVAELNFTCTGPQVELKERLGFAVRHRRKMPRTLPQQLELR